MKLKKLFWAKPLKSIFIVFLLSLVFVSCNTTSSLIPGAQAQQELDLYNQYMIIADEYTNQKKYDKAVKYYEQCLKCPELYWDAYYKIAKIAVIQSDWNKAEKMFKELLERDKDNATLKENLAYVYASKGSKEEAIKIYSELIETSGNKSSYYENIITIYIQLKNADEAQKYLSLLKEKFPDTQSIEKFQNAINSLKEASKEETSKK